MPSSRTRRLLAGVIAACLPPLLAGCGGIDVRPEALLEARITMEKVAALAVESAQGLTVEQYADAVEAGTAWPKPTFDSVGDPEMYLLPTWTGASFGVAIDTSQPNFTMVRTDYAVPAQASAGGGFNARLARVLVCVRIGVEFRNDQVEAEMSPAIEQIDCPADVLEYYDIYELVSLDEIASLGR
jgi:small ligand-binding sensory domain FIST